LIDVHVWWFRLDCTPDELAALSELLSPDERERVARFRFVHLQQHAAAARGFLRRTLATYLDRSAADLKFEYGPQGKPALVDAPVQFNLAHSGGLAVCAATSTAPLGVDVELVRADIDHAGIGLQSFSPRERAQLAESGPDGAVTGFFRCWTLKEAYVKGRGGGLSIPLDSFDVPLTAATFVGQPVVTRERAPEAHGWYATRLPVAPTHAAALAVHAAEWQVVEHAART
jgi:4'-phosphopantetheinyl transferase